MGRVTYARISTRGQQLQMIGHRAVNCLRGEPLLGVQQTLQRLVDAAERWQGRTKRQLRFNLFEILFFDPNRHGNLCHMISVLADAFGCSCIGIRERNLSKNINRRVEFH